MIFDPENKVNRLCVAGMEAEARDGAEAVALFQQAWELAANAVERVTAAHYLARNRADPEDALHWNLVALQHAEGLRPAESESLLPSLYLNAGRSFEDLGRWQEAGACYRKAAVAAGSTEQGDGYAEMIRRGIAAALIRIGAAQAAVPDE